MSTAVEGGQLLRVRELVARFARERGQPDAEDVAQEAVTRLLESRERLTQDAWASYALVTAHNLIVSRQRQQAVDRRHRHRLHLPDSGETAEERVLRAEQHAALAQAVQHLPQEDRQLLLHHYGDDRDDGRAVSGALAARLARARARLRVAYLLEHGRVELPTYRCRPVLEALSAGDRRRQERLGVARHLLTCATCATHAGALAQRRRHSVGLNPLIWLPVLGGMWWRSLRRNQVSVVATGTAVVLTAAVSATLVGVPQSRVSHSRVSQPGASQPVVPAPGVPAPGGPAPAPAGRASAVRPLRPAAGSVFVAGRQVLPGLPRPPLPQGPAEGRDVLVLAVPADEGFWVGDAQGERLWVQISTPTESPQTVRPRTRVSFTGRAVPVDAVFLARLRAEDPAAAAAVERQRGYVSVSVPDLVVPPG